MKKIADIRIVVLTFTLLAIWTSIASAGSLTIKVEGNGSVDSGTDKILQCGAGFTKCTMECPTKTSEFVLQLTARASIYSKFIGWNFSENVQSTTCTTSVRCHFTESCDSNSDMIITANFEQDTSVDPDTIPDITSSVGSDLAVTNGGKTLSGTIDVENSSNVDIKQKFRVTVKVGDPGDSVGEVTNTLYNKSFIVKGIKGKEKKSVKILYKSKKHLYGKSVIVTADPDSKVSEASKDNNTAQYDIPQPETYADLAVAWDDTNASWGTTGKSVIATLTISNFGTADSRPFVIGFYRPTEDADGNIVNKLIKKRTVPSIPAGSDYDVTLNYKGPVVLDEIIATADITGVVYELDLTNNSDSIYSQ